MNGQKKKMSRSMKAMLIFLLAVCVCAVSVLGAAGVRNYREKQRIEEEARAAQLAAEEEARRLAEEEAARLAAEEEERRRIEEEEARKKAEEEARKRPRRKRRERPRRRRRSFFASIPNSRRISRSLFLKRKSSSTVRS